GFEGPNGDECSPENWKYDRYFSPGQCPSGYKACTLPTETQRLVTTEICCPSGFDCVGQDLCSKTFSTPTHVTYTDSSVSTENTQRILGIKATPIQIRFEASDSTAVPIPTESFKLPEYTPPKKELSKREKAAIVAGSIASTVLLSLGAYFGWKHWKQRKYNSVSPSFPLDDDPPPPYTK
ncbi:hypothetical protein N7533_001716, partial [Penicillium manginii]|uniref:uncharacterized protein n=1 Tax=Penicillium manginii TaxID=203109 RepID=UPI002547E2C9